jgi:hypothetical protein
MRSTIALDLALTLILARLAGGVSGVALKLALGLKRCFSGDLLGMLDLTRDCLCLQSLLPGDFLSRQLRSLLGFRGLFLRLPLRGAKLARFNDSPALGFALDDGGIAGIVFRSGQKFFRLGFSGVGGGGLSI